mmetsp:Transcript_12469/g.19818  ORF Transcript_12469/g.19818 Transcript_12469/m.19818 type:complete len:331 (-) Transcript_12469:637-1629(-)
MGICQSKEEQNNKPANPKDGNERRSKRVGEKRPSAGSHAHAGSSEVRTQTKANSSVTSKTLPNVPEVSKPTVCQIIRPQEEKKLAGHVQQPMYPVAQSPSAKNKDDEDLKKLQPHYLKGDPTQLYTLGRRLNEAIFGSVNLATDRRTREQVVIKLSKISVKCIEDPLEEVRIMQQLQKKYAEEKDMKVEADKEELYFAATHPSLVHLKASYRVKDKLWTVLEFCGGGDAFDYVMERKRLDEYEARPLFQGLVEAVHFMHTHGACHLDLSLENALLTVDRKKMKLCDLGASREIPYEEDKGSYMKEQGLATRVFFSMVAVIRYLGFMGGWP